MSDPKRKHVQDLLGAQLESLWRFALRLTGNAHDAEDLVQKTCVRAMEKSATYTDVQKPQSWLYKIAQNVWKNELRSRSIRDKGRLALVSDSTHRYAAVETQTPESQHNLSEVVAAVERLPEAQRLVIILVAVEGFSYTEAASILDVPIGTIMSRLARARLAVGDQFSDMPDDKPVLPEQRGGSWNQRCNDKEHPV